MATQIKPTKKNSPAIHKPAKKFNGPAEEYAKPHTMSGKTVDVVNVHAGVDNNKEYLRNANVSVANSRSNEYPPTKTSGIVVRGTSAQTKGRMARGPMA
jgi:hypothetical protein